MVFKPFVHLARQSIAKSFVHGYAQPLVAASQSATTTPFSPFNTHLNRYNKAGGLQFHNAFQNQSTSASGAGIKSGHQSGINTTDTGLAAYYAAWQNHHNSEDANPWQQFQFPKRLEWRSPSSTQEGKGKETLVVDEALKDVPMKQGPLARHHSASDVDDIKEVIEDLAPSQNVALDATTQHESLDLAVPTTVDAASAQLSSVAEKSSTPESTRISSNPGFDSSVAERSLASSVTDFSSTKDSTHLDQLSALHESQQYDKIPVVFESMLLAGVKPTAFAYEALLTAALYLPAAKHQVVSKALEVYFDMLRRDVEPNSAIITTLMELLATRSMEVESLMSSLEGRSLRFRGPNGTATFRSKDAELDLLREERSLDIAVKIFTSTPSHLRALPSRVYHSLIAASAELGRINDMLHFQECLEQEKGLSSGPTFVSMINAFGASGDLSSAVECFNEYKALAIENDAGKENMISRSDQDVYLAVVKAYTDNQKTEGARRFSSKVLKTYSERQSDVSVHEQFRVKVFSDAFIGAQLATGKFANALQDIKESSITPEMRYQALEKICVRAADVDNLESAESAFQEGLIGSTQSTIAMLALHSRSGDLESARFHWNNLFTLDVATDATILEATTMYALAHISSGNIDEAVGEAYRMFARVQSAFAGTKEATLVREDIDEALDTIGKYLNENSIVPSGNASISLLRLMTENGTLIIPVAVQALASLGPEIIDLSDFSNLNMMLQVQAGVIASNGASIADGPRFAHILRNIMANGTSLDQGTVRIVDKTLAKMSAEQDPYHHYGLVQEWRNYLQSTSERFLQQVSSSLPSPAPMSSPAYESIKDPYNASTDVKGSSLIADELERNFGKSNASRLNEALAKFKNIRRAGRHPRYITYAKLISAAAREGRGSLVQELLAMAKTDVPLIPQNANVRHGWVSILDAMIGASLTLGDRKSAGAYHQDLLDLGSAPTANTFGLYITTLKESTKTFDEATEAVKIFLRARSEGVEPSSFLYNALIGKLGKARRIDDCLLYFGEMRTRGIRPTSVTYGTVVNALCRVSDEKFAEEIFEEMESMPNYKPRPAPYNSLMQFLLTTKRDRNKVLAYYDRMCARNIEPTMHTYKLLVDTYATLEPVDMAAAEGILDTIRKTGQQPEAVHYASLIHAKGCVLHEIQGARAIFDKVMTEGSIRPQASLYQALFEAMVANHRVEDTDNVLQDMRSRRVEMTPYIANTLIHGWAMENNVAKAKEIYDSVSMSKREPSTYEAMTRAYLAAEDRSNATLVVKEMATRGYPSAVAGKIMDLVGSRLAF
jgi:pentatricopeptide repeat protein